MFDELNIPKEALYDCITLHLRLLEDTHIENRAISPEDYFDFIDLESAHEVIEILKENGLYERFLSSLDEFI